MTQVYSKQDLLSDPVARALAARCTKEDQDPDVLARIRATTGLNSPLWFGSDQGQAGGVLLFWIPALIVLVLLAVYVPDLTTVTRPRWQAFTGYAMAAMIAATALCSARLLYHIATRHRRA
jgi:hypothetical protein